MFLLTITECDAQFRENDVRRTEGHFAAARMVAPKLQKPFSLFIVFTQIFLRTFLGYQTFDLKKRDYSG
jgi:hypothetical protein